MQILNNYFTLENEPENREIIKPMNNITPITDCNLTEEVIIRALDKLKINKTPEPDEIASRLLKETKYQVCKPLSILFQKSLNLGKLVEVSKSAQSKKDSE